MPFPATRLGAAGGCVCRLLLGDVETVRWNTEVPDPSHLPRQARVPGQEVRALQAARIGVCDLCSQLPVFFGNFEIAAPFPTGLLYLRACLRWGMEWNFLKILYFKENFIISTRKLGC